VQAASGGAAMAEAGHTASSLAVVSLAVAAAGSAAAPRDGGAAAAVGVGLRAGAAVVVGRAWQRARHDVPGQRGVADEPRPRERDGGVDARGVAVVDARGVGAVEARGVGVVEPPPAAEHAAKPEHVVVAAGEKLRVVLGGARVGRRRRRGHRERGDEGEEERGACVPCHGSWQSGGRAGRLSCVELVI